MKTLQGEILTEGRNESLRKSTDKQMIGPIIRKVKEAQKPFWKLGKEEPLKLVMFKPGREKARPGILWKEKIIDLNAACLALEKKRGTRKSGRIRGGPS